MGILFCSNLVVASTRGTLDSAHIDIYFLMDMLCPGKRAGIIPGFIMKQQFPGF